MDGQESREWAISVSRLSDVRSACHLLLLNVSAHITSVSGIWYSENVRIITERIYLQYNKLQFVRPFAFAYAVTIGSYCIAEALHAHDTVFALCAHAHCIPA